MSKRKANQNIRKPGNSDKFEPVKRKRNNRLRKQSTDVGAVVTDNPLWLFAYTAILFVGMWVAKLIF
jgi:hypothetical protein